MHSLLYPVCNEREAMRRQGLKPKDHAKENVRRIQELQRQKTQVLTADGCECVAAGVRGVRVGARSGVRVRTERVHADARHRCSAAAAARRACLRWFLE